MARESFAGFNTDQSVTMASATAAPHQHQTTSAEPQRSNQLQTMANQHSGESAHKR